MNISHINEGRAHRAHWGEYYFSAGLKETVYSEYCVLCYMVKNTTEIRRVILKGIKGKVEESEDDTHGIFVDIFTCALYSGTFHMPGACKCTTGILPDGCRLPRSGR